ncbi:Lipid storage droplets surface-binding protein 2 [Blattella germanica]|nr:Lipid storage droplets surface-binding protein 2 [Blattella germanica]
MYRTMEKATAESNTGPHLESLDKIMKIPLIEMTWNQSVGLYGKVKEANGIFRWTLSAAESAVLKAAEQAYPIAKKLEQPIHAVDQTVCKGIEIVEEKMPLIKEPPSHVYEAAKEFVNSTIAPTLGTVNAAKDYGTEKVQTIKDVSLVKANELLATRYGQMALSGFTTTAALAEKYLDYYFPATQKETEQDGEPAAETGDKNNDVMSTVHTVGRLSNKFTRRVYNILSDKVKNLNKDNVQEYVNSMATIMHITNHLAALNENLKATTSKAKDEKTPETETPKEETTSVKS